MSQKNLLKRPLLNFFIKLSTLTSAVIITFSFGLAIVINNINPPVAKKQVLGDVEVLNEENNPNNPELPLPPSENPQNPDNPDNTQNPIGVPSNPGNTNTPIFESDTVICYEIRSVSEEIGDIRNPDDPRTRNGSGNSGGTPTDPDKFTGQLVCYPKTNNQQPPTINNSNIFNAGSGNNGRCPDVYISTNNQPTTSPIIPNIYINNGLGGASNEVQRLNQNLACETNFPWWIVVLLSASLASLLIYLNSKPSQTSSQNSKQKPAVVS